MKKAVRSMVLFTAFAMITVLGLIAYVRLAPSEPAVWNVSPQQSAFAQGRAKDEVSALTGGAALHLGLDKGDPKAVLARLDAIALATPRTTRLAGRPDEGRITWITRSALWGFPDYTTAEVREDGVYIYARLRFGGSDLGVNAARLRNWLAQL
jgi:uncharacterized protein (DUF1499 family)